jgi:CHAT domain-containing protein
VPLVLLSGCSTALAARAGEGEAALPGLARGLLAQGVPAVLAMNGNVSDVYATRLEAQLYPGLATTERPEVLEALSQARRRVETVLSRS